MTNRKITGLTQTLTSPNSTITYAGCYTKDNTIKILEIAFTPTSIIGAGATIIENIPKNLIPSYLSHFAIQVTSQTTDLVYTCKLNGDKIINCNKAMEPSQSLRILLAYY